LSEMRLKRSRLLQFVGYSSFILYAYSLTCYECFTRDATNKDCDRTHNCTGSACLLYEGADKTDSSAFCLFSPFDSVIQKVADGCWADKNGHGKFCLCKADFCNRLRDRSREAKDDYFPLPQMEALQKNPLIDYSYIEDEKNAVLNRSPSNELKLPTDSDESFDGANDLVPIDLNAYQDWEEKNAKSEKDIKATTVKATTATSSVDKIMAELNSFLSEIEKEANNSRQLDNAKYSTMGFDDAFSAAELRSSTTDYNANTAANLQMLLSPLFFIFVLYLLNM
jgi:hypothetical protein